MAGLRLGSFALASITALWIASLQPVPQARADAGGLPRLSAPAHGSKAVRVTTDAAAPKITGLEADRCFEIREIVVEGIELVDAEEVRRAVEPFAWHCLGNVLAKALISAVNETHAAHGFVTTQGYVSPQDIKQSRTFVIKLVTGRVGRIIVREHREDETLSHAFGRAREADGPWGLLSALSAMAESLANPIGRFEVLDHATFPDLEKRVAVPVDPGDVLDLDAVQQGIDQMNRAPSRNATAKLAPGETPGTSDVVVDLPRTRSFRLNAGHEVNGAPPAGETTAPKRARVDLAKDDLLGIGDVWTASLASGLDNNTVDLGLSMPLRWLTLSLSGGYSENLAPLSTWSELYSRRWTFGLNTSYVLARSRSQQTSLDLGFTYRDAHRWINDVELAPQTAAIVRFGLGERRFAERTVFGWGLGANVGTSLLGATPTPEGADATVPRARFFKLDGNLGFERMFEGWGKLSLAANGQWSPTALYQDDQLTLGSLSSVRGFARAPVFADRGALLRAEFTPDLHLSELFSAPAGKSPFLQDVLGATQPYAFADAGAGYDIANAAPVSRASVGTGVRFDLGRTTFGWSVAVPVAWQGTSTGRQISRLESYMNLSIKLF